MAYVCRGCSYRGMSVGKDGRCPACGSFDISRQSSEAEPPPGRAGLIILLVLLAWLVGLVLWKLQH